MSKQSSWLVPALLVLSVAFLGVVIFVKNRPEKTEPAPENPSIEPTVPAKTSATPAAAKPSSGAVKKTANPEPAKRDQVARREAGAVEDIEITAADMTPFLRSEIASKWKNEFGYLDEDYVAAQRDLRAKGYSEQLINDPGVILRHLPPRHIGNVAIESIDLPSTTPAGMPVPFTLRGTAPSPTFTFTRFDILVQGSLVRIKAVGNSDADYEAGSGGPIALDGEIPPLSAGEYRVEVSELGPQGSFPFTVK